MGQIAFKKMKRFFTCQSEGIDQKTEITTTVILHKDLLPQKLIDHLVYLKLHHHKNATKTISFATKTFLYGNNDITMVQQEAFHQSLVGKYFYSTICYDVLCWLSKHYISFSKSLF